VAEPTSKPNGDGFGYPHFLLGGGRTILKGHEGSLAAPFYFYFFLQIFNAFIYF
jgi:hypothetical protein